MIMMDSKDHYEIMSIIYYLYINIFTEGREIHGNSIGENITVRVLLQQILRTLDSAVLKASKLFGLYLPSLCVTVLCLSMNHRFR